MLNDWYQQPVFSHLTAEERLQLVENENQIVGKILAKCCWRQVYPNNLILVKKVRLSSLPFFLFLWRKRS